MRISFKTWTDPNIGLIPLIVSATLIAGLAQAAIPRQVIADFLGEEAGLKGIALGTFLGSVIPGSPYVIFPLLGGLYKAGAGVGTIIAFISAWSLISLSRIPTELPFLGAKMVAVRIVVSLVFPVVLGTVGQIVFSQVSKIWG
ncbi:MAG: permease [Candidatus Bathyarchaeia archaeon]